MTNKEQIIINGVDVGECEYLTYQLEEDGQYYWFCNIAPAGGPDECECNPECFYKRVLKQLARKTQEYEELQVAYNKAQDIIGRVNGANELKSYSLQESIKECEELKEEIEALEKINRRNDQELLRRLTYASNAEKQRDRYRKALEEIAKIVTQDRNIKDVCLIPTCLETGRVAYDIQQQIIDIINKAKGDNK